MNFFSSKNPNLKKTKKKIFFLGGWEGRGVGGAGFSEFVLL